MLRRTGLWALIAAASLIGISVAQQGDRKPPQAPKNCSCTITARFGKAKVTTNGSVKVEDIEISGKVKSNPANEETFDPKIKVHHYLLYRVGGGAWTRAGGLQNVDVKLFGDAIACGAGGDFAKTFSHAAGEIGIPGADGAAVECEVHLWAMSEQCEMAPLRAYYKFAFTKGGKAENPLATLMKYDVKLGPDKKTRVAHVSAASQNGWSLETPMWYP